MDRRQEKGEGYIKTLAKQVYASLGTLAMFAWRDALIVGS